MKMHQSAEPSLHIASTGKEKQPKRDLIYNNFQMGIVA